MPLPTRGTEYHQRFTPRTLAQVLGAAEGEVALPALHATHLGTVDTEHLSEVLLAQDLGFSAGRWLRPNVHCRSPPRLLDLSGLLLVELQPYGASLCTRRPARAPLSREACEGPPWQEGRGKRFRFHWCRREGRVGSFVAGGLDRGALGAGRPLRSQGTNRKGHRVARSSVKAQSSVLSVPRSSR